MNSIYHPAASRGLANHGWLLAKHTFSFAGYFDSTRVHFGALRVLNDDMILGGGGFDMHPHDNMEIITIILKGGLKHKDSMGHSATIYPNDIQIMSAGTGIIHSEFNASETDTVQLLQIWVFPKERNVKPRYDQRTFTPKQKENNLLTIVSPNDPNAGYIHQNAWFSMGNFSASKSLNYSTHDNNNGVYVFVIEGELVINDQQMQTRDGLGISDTLNFDIYFTKDTQILLMEVPMHW